tara:strand:+ start:277 stop:1095 length:819 start_codon:yes stop_codon:yes gene_type:complete
MLITLNYLQCFILGTCIGSFLNVVIYRLPINLSIIKPRSFCPSCRTNLSWVENIPLLSWIIQKGRCIHCGKSISFRYPFIELITGILFVLFVKSSPTLYHININLFLQLILSWVFLSLLVCITFIDIDNLWIPQVLINLGLISGLLIFVLIDISKGNSLDQSLIIKSISSSIISFFIFEFLRKIAKYMFKKEAIGKGDSKLVAMLAMWLGPLGTLFAVAISYVFAAIYCLVGISINLLKLRQVIPFAPFLSIGALFVWFLGNNFFINKILRI